MISIQACNNKSRYSDLNGMYSGDSILIIGKASSENKLSEIYKPDNIEDALYQYGESDLVSGYSDAINLGAKNVFVLNAFKTTDYIDCLKIVKYCNFAFVVPIGISLSEKFLSSEYEKEMYFAEYYLNEFRRNCNSIAIFTDEKTEYYENISEFMNDMNYKVSKFKDECQYILMHSGENLLFCTNNLSTFKYSNIALATNLSLTTPGKYPESVNIKAIYDIDNTDIDCEEIIYFKNNLIVGTTIENLKNFRIKYDSSKLVAVNMVIKNIERALDLTPVIGKFYNDYMKIYVIDYINKELRKMIGVNLRNFRITDIEFIKNPTTMTGIFILNLVIHPINSLEKIEASLEVNLR